MMERNSGGEPEDEQEQQQQPQSPHGEETQTDSQFSHCEPSQNPLIPDPQSKHESLTSESESNSSMVTESSILSSGCMASGPTDNGSPLTTSMSRKLGWLPFPPGPLKTDDREMIGNASSQGVRLSQVASDDSPAPERHKSYEIEVRQLYYKLSSKKNNLTKLKEVLNKKNTTSNGHGTSPTSSRYLLRNINFVAKPGEVLAIAGPSGAGKSTLMECLAGRIKPSSPPESILVNKQVVDPAHFRRISGYVMQDDALFPTLTVSETLLFSARLRLPSNMPSAEKNRRVESLMGELGLQHAANTRIGNDMNRGVSGGERRRVSIGVDLIHDPAVLILDEPTSGLDSAAAMNIVKMLRTMAEQRGRTVILSIHQPSFRLLQLLHSVLLLAGGMVVHHGDLDYLATRLTTGGHRLPAQANVLEFAIDAVNSWESESLLGIYATIAKGLTLEDLFAVDNNKEDVEKGLEFDESNKEDDFNNHDWGGAEDPVYPNSVVQEVMVLTHRFFLTISRTKELFIARSMQAVIAGTILGTVFLHMDKDRQGVQDRLGFISFTLTFLLNSTTEALPIFLQERQILMRETSRGAYRISSYVLSHAVVFVPFLLIIGGLYALPSYWLAGLWSSFGSFTFYALVLWLAVLLANSFVSFFSALVPNYIMGQALISAFMGAFYLFSGYIISRNNIPKYWIWMHYISLFKFPFDALLLNEFGPQRNYCFDYLSDSDVCTLTGSQVLHNAGVQGKHKWVDVAIVVAFIILYRVLAYFAVRFRLSQRQR